MPVLFVFLQLPRHDAPLTSNSRLLTHSIVDIYVGAESTHWPIHEKLLCYHSPFFASIFYDKKADSRPKPSKSTKSYGLPEEDDLPFELLVGWLYSRAIKAPKEEKDIGPLLDLYLLADKFEMEKLAEDVVNLVREFYHSTGTYPGLRRVQYIYANTSDDNTMREMMVGSIARFLALGDTIPNHWAKALKRNGQLALDIIRSIQEWHLESRSVPDARDASADRGRLANGAFSSVEEEKEEERPGSKESNETTGTTDSMPNGEETLATSVDEAEQSGQEEKGGDKPLE
jgi:BTB/POZ domain